MKIINILRFFRGYVKFQAVGGFGERFINLCATNDISLFDMKYVGNAIEAKIYADSFSSLDDIADKSGVTIVLCEKTGLSFFIKAHRDRSGLAFGALFFILFIVLMNNFIWCITTSGSQSISESEIIRVAESCGVRFGVYVGGLDEEKAGRDIYNALGGKVRWVKVNIKGSMASVSLRDALPSPPQEDKSPCNIIADFDGVIVSDETYSGVKNISKGSAVKKGDLLISGVVENPDLSAAYYKAEGSFTAMHNAQIKNESKAFRQTLSFSGDRRGVSLRALLPGLGLYHKTDDEIKLSTDYQLRYQGYLLPFSYGKIILAKQEESVLSKEKSFILQAEEFTENEYKTFKNTKILSREYSFDFSKQQSVITGDYSCVDFIGESKPIITKNIESE